MPSMANIVVKNAIGADVTYSALQASGGEKSPAIWLNTARGSAPAFHPEFRMTSRSNTDRTNRVVDVAFSYPFYVTSGDTGVTSVLSRMNFSGTFVVPQSASITDVQEAVLEGARLVASDLVTASTWNGYAPT
jgi:hypothetical protein